MTETFYMAIMRSISNWRNTN